MAEYLADMERMWQENRKQETGTPAIFNFQLEAGLRRPRTLRGPDLVHELMRLAALTQDARFAYAVFALLDHRIVGDKFNFLPWDLPLLTESKERIRRLACVCIHLMKNSGRSLRRACAEHAARTGWPAMSFAAAIKDLELLYRQHPEFVTPAAFAEFRIERVAADGQALPIPADLLALFGEVVDPTATTLENSCSTSIPTTADN
jgi:hypothetical protein